MSMLAIYNLPLAVSNCSFCHVVTSLVFLSCEICFACVVPFKFMSFTFQIQEGPDILVCDEAHIIKNTKADATQALKQVKCQRRIALTGSPLQNNLMEYYCVS